jgi:hypothetical protein
LAGSAYMWDSSGAGTRLFSLQADSDEVGKVIVVFL